ncbi:MAG: hypothetical protein ABI855_10950 [Bacteroidota bacterium]
MSDCKPSKKNKAEDLALAELLKKRTDEILKNCGEKTSKEDIEWAENVYRLLKIKKSFSNTGSKVKWGIDIIIVLVCIILGGLLLFFRIGDLQFFDFLSTNNISLRIQCRTMQCAIADSQNSEIINTSFQTSEFKMVKVNSINVTHSKISYSDSLNGYNVDLKSNSISLKKIRVGNESVININQSKDVTSLTKSGNKQVMVSASFKNAEFLEPDTEKISWEDTLRGPHFGYFESFDEKTYIEIKLTAPFNILEGKKITALSFSDSASYGSDLLKYFSTIQSGKLTLSDVNRDVELDHQDRLVLTTLSGWIVDFTCKQDSLELFFKGTAKEIKAGPQGSEKDLRPRLLEYFVKNEPLSLFWAAIVFLWGLFSSILSRFRQS